MSFDDDNDFGEDGSSDDEQNDQDDQGDDQDDQEGDGDGDGDENDQDDDDEGDGDDDDDGDGDGEGGDGDGDGEDTEMQDATQSDQPTAEKRQGTLTMPSQDSNDPLKLAPSQAQSGDDRRESQDREQKDESTRIDHFEVRPGALTALTYDIAPTIAAPHSTSINCVTATPNLKYVLSGGSDGYIRKFNWPDTANGKLMLTVAQRHPFVDSVVKAGVLTSYWENNDGGDGKPESLSPVYSLAMHRHALWVLSGLESGGINLMTVRHSEGSLIIRLKQHTSAVSVLQLAPDERSFLSGSWDKRILDWDLDNGHIIRSYDGSPSQISAIELRPQSSLPVPRVEEPPRFGSSTYSSNNEKKPLANGTSNGVPVGSGAQSSGAGQPSPAPSNHSFSSLFGDDDNDNAMDTTNFGGPGGDEDNDLFGGAVTNDMRPGELGEDTLADTTMADAPNTTGGTITSEPAVPAPAADNETQQHTSAAPPSTPQLANGNILNGTPTQSTNPHSSEPMAPSFSGASTDPPPQSNSTFLSASIDGSIRIWDRRQSAAVVKLPSRYAPPWCMSAVWSPDGNSFYAGRRNGTVEEYSLHKPLAAPSRTFRFPSGSGPVSALKAMPNGRHLVCASYDILRLYDLQHEEKANQAVGKTPFLIVPGHRTGVVSSLYLDPTCTFMISTAGTRGWEGTSTQVLLGYEIGF